jgi:hypothetical protein
VVTVPAAEVFCYDFYLNHVQARKKWEKTLKNWRMSEKRSHTCGLKGALAGNTSEKKEINGGARRSGEC